MRRSLLVLVTAAALIAGCGGSSADERAAGPSVLEADAAADREKAEASTLRIEDFPTGWKQGDVSEGNDESCAAFVGAEQTKTSRSEAPRFEADTAQAFNKIYVFPDVDTAKESFDAFEGEDTAQCFAETVAEGITGEDGLTVEGTGTERINVGEVGDQLTAARIKITLTSEGGPVDLYLDLVTIRARRGISVVGVIEGLKPFDKKLRADLLDTSAKRLAEQLA
jgi:hypothetical protein